LRFEEIAAKRRECFLEREKVSAKTGILAGERAIDVVRRDRHSTIGDRFEQNNGYGGDGRLWFEARRLSGPIALCRIVDYGKGFNKMKKGQGWSDFGRNHGE
jgi:hypothetical protein